MQFRMHFLSGYPLFQSPGKGEVVTLKMKFMDIPAVYDCFQVNPENLIFDGLFRDAVLIDLPNIKNPVAVKIRYRFGPGFKGGVRGFYDLVFVIGSAIVIDCFRRLKIQFVKIGGEFGVHVPVGGLRIVEGFQLGLRFHTFGLGNERHQVGQGYKQQNTDNSQNDQHFLEIKSRDFFG